MNIVKIWSVLFCNNPQNSTIMPEPPSDLDQHQLFDTYLKNILESGLLLDEDLDILLSLYKIDSTPTLKIYKPSFQLIASLSSLLISLPLAKKFHSKLIAVSSVFITLAIAAFELKSARNRKKKLSLMKNLVTILKKIHSLDVSIKRYMKTRLEIGRKCEESFPTFQEKEVSNFFETTAKSELSHFRLCMDMLNTIASFSDDLTDDFNRIEDFNPFDAGVAIPNDMEEGVAFTTRLQDIHIWLSSKLLSYIGILFCSDCHKLNKGNVKGLLDVAFPNILSHMEGHYEAKRKSFQSLRYSVNKWTEYKSQKRTKPEKIISAKLQGTLESIVDNLSIISEKSVNILEIMEKNGSRGSRGVDKALLDLRNHTYTAYESLDLLCRLYGVLSNKTSVNTLNNAPPPTIRHEVDIKNIPLIHHDDMTEPLEENFELYLDAEDVPEEKTIRMPEDQSGAYLNLMLQELKQSLKQHERFIEAKKKRGSQDEEQEVENRSESPPRFDLNVLSNTTTFEEKTEEPTKMEGAMGNSPLNKGMPPPPPLPMFDLGKLDDESCTSYNNRTLLDNIKALSGQLGGQEEVFSISE